MPRLISADRIHDGERFLPAGTVLEADASGRILHLHQPGSEAATEHIEGILCPGFVNAHCHLELSHMAAAIPERTGLITFLQSVMRGRGSADADARREAREAAYAAMEAAGIVAVGDIANTADTLTLRAAGRLHIHTFVECIGFVEATAAARLDASLQVYDAFRQQEKPKEAILRESVVPHAPYSVSGELFRLINNAIPGSLISIHNQETPDEDAYYRDKSGRVGELLAGLGIDDAYFTAPGCTSLRAYLPYFDETHPLLLVHNTCTTAADIRFAQTRRLQPYWCLCPGANLYIEDRLPDIPTLAGLTDRICIGTDSLASNHQLSILAELRLIARRYPDIGLERLLRWACSGGADALQLGEVCGRFRPGAHPGIIALPENLDPAGVRRIA